MPYVHFTTSAVLPFLGKSGNSLCGLDAMLYQYGYAPMAGEIDGGGVVGVSDDVTTAFASIHKDDKGTRWNTANLYQDYGKHEWKADLVSEDDVRELFETRLFEGDLGSIRPIIVTLLRHKQMGQLPDISDELIQRAIEAIQAKTSAIQQQFLANYIVAKYICYAEDITRLSQVSTYRFLCELENNIPANFLFLSEANQRLLIDELILPEGLVIKESAADDASETSKEFEYNLSLSLKSPGRIEFMQHVLASQFETKQERHPEYVKNQILSVVKRMEDTRLSFERIFDEEHGIILTKEEQQEVEQPFPIAFILEDCKKLELARDNEYRSTERLDLGDDITIVATDRGNVTQLELFFKQARIRNIRVINMEQLKQLDFPPGNNHWDFFSRKTCSKVVAVGAVVATTVVTASMMAYANENRCLPF